MFLNGNDYSNAMLAYTKAASLNDGKDSYLSAMFHSAISATYSLSHDNEEALKNARLAYENYLLSGKTENSDLLLFNIATCSANNNAWKDVDSLFSILLNKRDSVKGISANQIKCNYAFMKVCQPQPDYDNARSLYSTVLSDDGFFEGDKDYGAYAYVLAEAGDVKAIPV